VLPETVATFLPFRSAKRVDARALAHRGGDVGHEVAGREIDLRLALRGVGGGRAIQVDRAVLQERNAVGRVEHRVAHVDLRQTQLGLHRIDDLQADVVGEADGRAVGAQLVGERDLAVARADLDRAALLDLLQGAAVLGAGGGAGEGEGESQGERQQLEEVHGVYSLVCRRRGGLGESSASR
jgi:hypothetical protein